MQECLKDPPKPTKPPKKTKTADAWSIAGCTIQVARPMTKSLLERFENPVIKVSIKTGEVLRDRVREFLG